MINILSLFSFFWVIYDFDFFLTGFVKVSCDWWLLCMSIIWKQLFRYPSWPKSLFCFITCVLHSVYNSERRRYRPDDVFVCVIHHEKLWDLRTQTKIADALFWDNKRESVHIPSLCDTFSCWERWFCWSLILLFRFKKTMNISTAQTSQRTETWDLHAGKQTAGRSVSQGAFVPDT